MLNLGVSASLFAPYDGLTFTGTTTAPLIVSSADTAPTATFSTSAGAGVVRAGTPVLVSLANPPDPSAAEMSTSTPLEQLVN